MDIKLLREEVFRMESLVMALAHYAEGGPDCNDERGHIEFVIPILLKESKDTLYTIGGMIEAEEIRQNNVVGGEV